MPPPDATVVLTTGANSGIGLATAIAAARAGFRSVGSVRSKAKAALLYHASKHALEATSDALRMEVAGAGIKVVLVEPGAFRTAIWDEMERDVEGHQGSPYESAYRRSLQAARLGQPLMGQPEGAARVIVGALKARSPRARYLVGYDAKALALVQRVAPTAIKDRVMRLTLGL
ncbi:MAG: SDR family NAD(P)-dependent oxidoreductase [Acidimicrobiia bacterium]|nr:SDR family NAD(P)-dependent oxidoreductase [Acidimicrobiia bacterium]